MVSKTHYAAFVDLYPSYLISKLLKPYDIAVDIWAPGSEIPSVGGFGAGVTNGTSFGEFICMHQESSIY